MTNAPAFSWPTGQPSGALQDVERRQRLTQLAERLARSMALSRALARSGRTVDLRGIDDGVGQLCAQALDLPADEGRRLLPVLHELLGQVDALTTALRGGARITAPRGDALNIAPRGLE
jgi:hypothetical protein